MNLKSILVLALIILTLACNPDIMSTEETDPNPEISNTPEIELLSVDPIAPVSYQDSIVFKIKYLDGDGDLGELDPDIPSIELVDQREPDLLIFEYHLSPRTPKGSSLTVQGELDIILDNTILLDDQNESEQTTFMIRLKDRAGNWSNSIETETITVSQ